MSEFVPFEKMVERIRDILQRHSANRVWDYDVAEILQMDVTTLASFKRRNTPPLKKILLFCQRTGLDPMKILF